MEMQKDMCVECGEGLINIRVGAIIMKDNAFLMARNRHADYYYSVGGRLKFGETAEEAVQREVREETGVDLEVSHLGFVLENYFTDDSVRHFGKEVYEISYFFYMKTPADFEPVARVFYEGESEEILEWVTPDEKRTVFPEFFRTELDPESHVLRHMVKDDRCFIRKMREDDLDELFRLLSDEEVMYYLEKPFDREKTERFLRENGLAEAPRIWAVTDRKDGFMGYVIYHEYDETSMEIGWVLKREIWGQGYAGLLTKQLVAKAEMEEKDAVIECLPEQKASIRIAEKYGFEKVGERDGLLVFRRKR